MRESRALATAGRAAAVGRAGASSTAERAAVLNGFFAACETFVTEGAAVTGDAVAAGMIAVTTVEENVAALAAVAAGKEASRGADAPAVVSVSSRRDVPEANTMTQGISDEKAGEETTPAVVKLQKVFLS